MVKKKDRSAEEPQAEPLAMVPQPPAEATKRDYETTTWAGHVLYRCLSCPYDTFDELEIEQHVQLGQHIKAQAMPEVQSETKEAPIKHEATVVEMPDGQRKLIGAYEMNLEEVQNGESDVD